MKTPRNILAAALGGLALAAAAGEVYLKLDGGAELYSTLPAGELPDYLVAPLQARLQEGGYHPFESTPRPPDTWCTSQLRAIVLTNGVYRETWVEAAVPVPLDRGRLVEAILAMPGGTNLLRAAITNAVVAGWFAQDNPTYVRGSEGAEAVGAAMGLTRHELEYVAWRAMVREPAKEDAAP